MRDASTRSSERVVVGAIAFFRPVTLSDLPSRTRSSTTIERYAYPTTNRIFRVRAGTPAASGDADAHSFATDDGGRPRPTTRPSSQTRHLALAPGAGVTENLGRQPGESFSSPVLVETWTPSAPPTRS